MKSFAGITSIGYMVFALVQIANAGDYPSTSQLLTLSCYFMLWMIVITIEEGQDHDPS